MLNFVAYAINGFRLKGSALSGKKTPEGFYMVHSHGRYNVVSEEDFINYRRQEIIFWYTPVIVCLFYFTLRFFLKDFFKGIEAHLVNLNESLDGVTILKKIDSRNLRRYYIILVIIYIIIHVSINIYSLKQLEANSPKSNREDSSKKQTIDGDQSSLFPPPEDVESLEQEDNK